MKEINEAYEILADTTQKVKIDQSLSELVRFTYENFKYLARQEDLWIINIHSHWCRDCKRAYDVTQKACAHFEGMINCGSISSDSEVQLARDLGVMRVPTIIFRAKGNTYEIPYSRHKTEPSSIIKAVSKRFPTELKELKKLKYVETFLNKNWVRLKAVFVSNTRSTPHILHRWLAYKFRDHATFRFLPLKNFHSSELPRLRDIIGEKLDIPLLALFEGPDLMATVIELTNDPEQMFYRLESTLKRVPRIPELQPLEYYNRCYTKMEDSMFDSSKICILLLLSNPSLWIQYQKKMVPVAEEHDNIQFIWVDCKKQKVFCNDWSPNSKLFVERSSLRILGMRGPKNIHSLSPVITKSPDLMGREEISNWVGKFIKGEVETKHGRCAFPQLQLESNFDILEDGWIQSFMSFGSSTVSKTSDVVSGIITLFTTIFFLLLFLLIMCLVSGSNFQFRTL